MRVIVYLYEIWNNGNDERIKRGGIIMRKKRMIGASCLILLLSMIGYQTLAYYTAESTTTNVISTNYVEMELYEEIKADGVNWEFIPIEETVSIMPGDVVEQKAYVKNTGSEDFYARVSAEVSVVDADGEALSAEVVSLNIDTENWVLDEDGWYRYINIVPAGETTEAPLFTDISFSTAMDNSYIGCTITIVVGSQSVQSTYNEYDMENGETVLDVEGFPESEVVE